MKFAGFFVEKVPIEPAGPTPGAAGGAGGGMGLQPHPHLQQQHQQHQQFQQQPSFPQAQPGGGGMPGAGQHQQHVSPGLLEGHWNAPAAPAAQQRQAPLAIALRAWVPQEYAGFLTPFALHVIAAGGELTVEQARAYGAQAIVVSSECLGAQMQLLTSPQLPTVFVAPQPVSVPVRAGLVQVQEPLRASELAAAIRDAVSSWAGGVTGM